jgi:hypothetical protein
MSGHDPFADWRRNPFFVLGVSPQASPAEVERAGQKLVGLLALGSMTVTRYDTPFGPASRDADTVRQAVAALRDPVERVIHELWAGVSPIAVETPRAWEAAERAIGWTGKCPE